MVDIVENDKRRTLQENAGYFLSPFRLIRWCGGQAICASIGDNANTFRCQRFTGTHGRSVEKPHWDASLKGGPANRAKKRGNHVGAAGAFIGKRKPLHHLLDYLNRLACVVPSGKLLDANF